MNASRSQAALCDFKAAPFAKNDVFSGHAHIFELNFRMAMGRVVITEHRQITFDLHAGVMWFHQNLRLLGVAAALGAGLAHHDEHLAARVERPR